MKKNKKKISLKERLKKAKNPLAGVKTRDLIITLLALLICFFSGFFGGYACNKSCKRVEASADSVSQTSRKIIFSNWSGGSFYALYTIKEKINGIRDLFPLDVYVPLDMDEDPKDFYLEPFEIMSRFFADEEGYYFTVDRSLAWPNYYSADDEFELASAVWDYDDTDDVEYIYSFDDFYGLPLYVSHRSFGSGEATFYGLLVNSYGFCLDYRGSNSRYVLYVGLRYFGSNIYNLTSGFDGLVGNYYTWSYFFGTSVESAFDEGYERGKAEGQTIGKQEGLSEGEQLGYERGKAEGEEIGYQRGIGETLDDITPWQHIVNGVNRFLNIQLFPGVSFSLLISLAFGLILLGIVWKTFLGG